MTKFNIPGWKTPDKIKQRNHEIDELAKKISNAAFKKSKDQGTHELNLQKIRIHNPRTAHPQYFTIKTDPKIIKEMVHLIAGKIWDFLYEGDPDKFVSSAKEEIDEDLENIKGYLESYAGGYDKKGIQRIRLFHKKSVKEAMKVLSNNAYSRLDKKRSDSKNMPRIIKEMVKINPRAHEWIKKENTLSADIRDLYKSYIPAQKTKNHIVYFVSLVYEACDLWGDANYYERMKKRFQKIKYPVKHFFQFSLFRKVSQKESLYYQGFPDNQTH